MCTDNNTILTITGKGEVFYTPNVATISTSVQTDGKDAAEAMTLNASTMHKLVATLEEKKVAKADTQTANMSVDARYSYPDKEEPKLLGYRALNTLSVRVRNLSELGPIVDALVASGSNKLSGPEFGILDSSKLLNEARIKAVEECRERADLYAKAAGLKVQRIVSITEEERGPRPTGRGLMMCSSAGPTPMEAGEQSVTASVTMKFELV